MIAYSQSIFQKTLTASPLAKIFKTLCEYVILTYSTEAKIAFISETKSSFLVLTAFTRAFFNKDFALFGLLKLIISSAAAL